MLVTSQKVSPNQTNTVPLPPPLSTFNPTPNPTLTFPLNRPCLTAARDNARKPPPKVSHTSAPSYLKHSQVSWPCQHTTHLKNTWKFTSCQCKVAEQNGPQEAISRCEEWTDDEACGIAGTKNSNRSPWTAPLCAMTQTQLQPQYHPCTLACLCALIHFSLDACYVSYPWSTKVSNMKYI